MDFESSEETEKIITAAIAGRTVESVKLYQTGVFDKYMEITFKDGSTMKIQYEYIYSWDFALQPSTSAEQSDANPT